MNTTILLLIVAPAALTALIAIAWEVGFGEGRRSGIKYAERAYLESLEFVKRFSKMEVDSYRFEAEETKQEAVKQGFAKFTKKKAFVWNKGNPSKK